MSLKSDVLTTEPLWRPTGQFWIEGLYGQQYAEIPVEDVGDLYAVVLGLGGLGLVGIVFYGLDYPGDVVFCRCYSISSASCLPVGITFRF